MTESPSSTRPTFPERYCRLLQAPARDVEGRRWPSGTAVLANPVRPGEFLIDTDEHRQRFRESCFAWSQAGRERAADADLERLTHTPDFQAARETRQAFADALHVNLKAATGTPFPYERIPLRAFLMPWHPRTRRFKVSELDDRLAQVIGQRTFPVDLRCSSLAQELLQELTTCRVYELSALGRKVHVVVAFTVTFSSDGQELQVTATDSPLDLVKRAYDSWVAAKPRRRDSTTTVYYSIGSIGDLPPPEVPQQRVVYSTPAQNGGWTTVTASTHRPWPHVTDFLRRLSPITREERIAAVKDVVDRHFAATIAHQADSVRVRDVLYEQPNLDRRSVQDAMVELQASDYAVRRGADRELEVRPRHLLGDRILPPTHVRLSTPVSLRLGVSMIPPTILLASVMLRDYLAKGIFEWMWFFIGIPVSIAAAWIVGWIEILRQRDR